jgi:hypothetical protein
MRQPSVQIDREKKNVTIIMPLEKPRPSKSTGKTRVIATTGGLKTSEESYARRPVCFTANVFFYPATRLNPDEDGQRSAGSEEAQRSTKRSRDRQRDLATTGGSAGSTKA